MVEVIWGTPEYIQDTEVVRASRWDSPAKVVLCTPYSVDY